MNSRRRGERNNYTIRLELSADRLDTGRSAIFYYITFSRWISTRFPDKCAVATVTRFRKKSASTITVLSLILCKCRSINLHTLCNCCFLKVTNCKYWLWCIYLLDFFEYTQFEFSANRSWTKVFHIRKKAAIYILLCTNARGALFVQHNKTDRALNICRAPLN